MTQLGIAITLSQTCILVIAFVRKRQGPLAWYGWAGFIGLLLAEALLFAQVRPVATYFTPIAWTCYILLVDAAVLAVKGQSRLHDRPGLFVLLALVSIPLWLIFEAYNLRLQNWIYVGVPEPWPLSLLGYGWAFATITPAILETADLVESFRYFPTAKPVKFSSFTRACMVLLGAICLLVPLVVAQSGARRLFGLVWIGFIFLLDPVNRRLGLPSLLGDFERGQRSRFYALLTAGFVCGW